VVVPVYEIVAKGIPNSFEISENESEDPEGLMVI
jgi:hypothetical protein